MISDQIELRKWCIEQALRWPVFYEGGGVGYPQPSAHEDADVIGRAEEIFKWVSAT